MHISGGAKHRHYRCYHKVAKTLAALCAASLLCSLSACSATLPRLAGRAEAERQMSPCEQALTQATQATQANAVTDADVTGLSPAEPLMVRYLKAQSVPLAWIDVAGTCPARFGEGVLRNAQSKYQLATMAAKLGQDAPAVSPARLDGVTEAAVPTDVLGAFALAEDRAGFAIEVLAARDETTGATLTVSDMHKTAAQQLVSLALRADDTYQDPRLKVYAVDQLLANPSTIADAASGRSVPTAAAVEMDCARTEIAALDTADGRSNTDTVLILAALAAKHAYNALQLGYPADDTALFD